MRRHFCRTHTLFMYHIQLLFTRYIYLSLMRHTHLLFMCCTHPLFMCRTQSLFNYSYIANSAKHLLRWFTYSTSFFSIFIHPPSTPNYSITWLSIFMLQLKQGLMKLVMQFIMADIQIMYKLLVYRRFFFVGYKDGGMEAR